MNRQSIAVSAMFLHEGLTEGRLDDILRAWSKGGIELMLEVSADAVLCAAVYDYFSVSDLFDFPGVYDYEVSEPLGHWTGNRLLERGDVPTGEQRCSKLYELALAFFTQGDPSLRDRCHDALIEVFIKEA